MSGASGAISHFFPLVIQSCWLHPQVYRYSVLVCACIHLEPHRTCAYKHQSSMLPKLHHTALETLSEIIHSGIKLSNLQICTTSVFLITSLVTFHYKESQNGANLINLINFFTFFNTITEISRGKFPYYLNCRWAYQTNTVIVHQNWSNGPPCM